MRVRTGRSWVLLAALVASGASSAAGEPAPRVDALRLDHRGGYGRRRVTEEPYLEVRSDGRLRAPDLVGTTPAFEARLPVAEADALFAFVVREQGFFGIDAKAIAADAGAEGKPDDPVLGLVDAPETVVAADVGGKRHAVAVVAPSVLADLHPENVPLARFRAVVDRLENEHAVARAGGRERAASLVARGNAALAAEEAKAPAFGVGDLRYLGGDASVSTYRLSRKEPPSSPTSKVRATTVIFLRVPRTEGRDGVPEARIHRTPER